MITLKNVSKWYGHFQVLTDCSTEVKKGKWWWFAAHQVPESPRLSKPLTARAGTKGEITVNGTMVNDKKPIWQSYAHASGWCSSTLSCSRICRSSKT